MEIAPLFSDGPDESAMERLSDAFPQPAEPMGEAWFMGSERRLFPELRDPVAADLETVEEAVLEMAAGPACFGPYDTEWRDWLNHLLPRLVRRAAEAPSTRLLERLVSALVAQHPLDLEPEPVPGFRSDVLATLGRIAPRPVLGGHSLDLWIGGLSSLSAVLVLHLKYRVGAELDDLAAAFLDARDPARRAERLAWLVGAHGLLTGAVRDLSTPRIDDGPDIGFEGSHVLDMVLLARTSGAPLPTGLVQSENGTRFLSTLRTGWGETGLLDWIVSIEADEEIAGTLLDLPLRALDLYG